MLVVAASLSLLLVSSLGVVVTSDAATGSLSISRNPNSLSNQLANAPLNSLLICDLFQNISQLRFAAGRRALVKAKDDYLERAYDVGDCNLVGHEAFFGALEAHFGDITVLSEMADGYSAIAQRISDNGECSIPMVQQGEVFQNWKRLLFGVSVFAHLPRCSQDPSHLPLLKEAVKYPPPKLVIPQCESILFEHCYGAWERKEEVEEEQDSSSSATPNPSSASDEVDEL